MEEKYYIIDEKNRECGAFTEDELNDVGLYEDSLIFCPDWSERKPLNQITELAHIKRKNESVFSLNEYYGQYITTLKQTAKNTNQPEKIKEWENPFSFKKKKVRIVVVSWFILHLWAFFIKQIAFKTTQEWVYSTYYPYSKDIRRIIWPFNNIYSRRGNLEFEFFRGYDLTEFFGYNLLFIFIWFLLFTKNQKSL
jgi:hypothetical protein